MKTKKKAAKKAAKKKVAKKRAPRGPIIPAAIYGRVERGVKLLDMLIGRKEWLSRMDLKEFDIKDPNTCVAGSVWAECYSFDVDGFENDADSGYDVFCKMLDLVGSEGTAHKFGFNTEDRCDDDHDTEFQQLQDVWVRTIQELKKRAR